MEITAKQKTVFMVGELEFSNEEAAHVFCAQEKLEKLFPGGYDRSSSEIADVIRSNASVVLQILKTHLLRGDT